MMTLRVTFDSVAAAKTSSKKRKSLPSAGDVLSISTFPFGMSSAAPESESAGLLPSQSRVSDHDSSRDERVVTVEPVTAAAASSAAPSDASSPIGSKSDDMSGIVGPLNSALEGLKFQIACMPVLRLKVPSRARCNPQILVPPASTFAS